MDIYLPIAEVSVDIFVLLGLGAAVGFLSGVFGVGGGFLLTPLLIFIGVPPTVAVASSANQLVGASVAGVLAHWRRGNVDFKMGYVLLILVLAADIGAEGPGPLISNLIAQPATRLRIPITIVPGDLTIEQLDAVS
jgi:uncharacterized membrane protein YfcA